MAQLHINTLADICAKHGVRQAIISPGSRNAPLTIAFNRHPSIKCYSISDERSAAFIALGMAQASGEPVVIICTSGSAALNYTPAVAEAFFQYSPLLILTADRPPEWIDQWDGQTIRQRGIYAEHVKKSFHLPLIDHDKMTSWHAYRSMNEACIATKSGEKGPVHVNIPFREPFYPEKDQAWLIDESAQLVQFISSEQRLDQNTQNGLLNEFAHSNKPAILLGQDNYDSNFLKVLNEVSIKLNIPIFADVLSNGHLLKNSIQYTDAAAMWLHQNDESTYVPDLLISFGKSIISKNLKTWLRKNKVTQWHVDLHKVNISDPFMSLSKMIQTDPIHFLNLINTNPSKSSELLDSWQSLNASIKAKTLKFLSEQNDFNEFSSLNKLLNSLNDHCQIHLANSLSVRYVNFIGMNKAAQVWCNRGTSGIDGSSSTAVGHSLANKNKQHILITGDVAFFYDRNAFWNKYNLSNLKIVLINNKGGSIFRMINGPKEQEELEEFFLTEQNLDASLLSKEFGLDYFCLSKAEQLDSAINSWLSSDNTSLLEIQTESKVNEKIFESFKKHILK